ncbi:hypothetical protein M0813_00992 [Anaeramoeba flamelloides]|uniref:Protein phosphatase inhibitor 2 n=1 Tax=Anaeramoeba flamelloides TaxID=1746091 RepID=A0ABQ8X1T3_9EUKA|nr:hypothetical protein M0813_00992 [Anaeramoeba flamelloides]
MTESISTLQQEELPRKKSITWNETNLKEINEIHSQIFKSPKKNEEKKNKNKTALSEEFDEEFDTETHTKQFLEKRENYKKRQKQIRTQPNLILDITEKDELIKNTTDK